ncbi:DeoR/GlpR family DNA-binding transcription regulator [Planomicrobium sp. CPCC 101079]|uniref:DeoR/GlpR family DNA-binding transcription regulator n=1 Tax=Planomicrobium sp. CPCC 101079 TaxID=2599618 RepID=UPI0011B818E1|nr:DeoR/GlpR family DNA-binding transcription regulator [Planomicrobium sp. CPCC 101079]TWT01942.1 DeoR/GlpR transcriptional regulator [Planomicrobium sp. CPCC 101079]
MLVAERHKKMASLVNERGSSRVSELSRIFKVTEETIRRDLEKLETEGKLKRSHGGAVSIKENDLESSYSEREIRNVQEKMAVAKEAIKHVSNNDRIILDASTTAWYMAKILPDMPLTVVTNSLKVAMELATREKITVISIGGTLVRKSLSFVGPQTTNALDCYHVNKAFISCQGVHPVRGISDSSEMQALVKKKMSEIADEVYLLADHTKFGLQALSWVASMQSVDFIVTDSKTSENQLKDFRDYPVAVIQPIMHHWG